MRIAVDVMGSDHGPEALLEGVQMALQQFKSIGEMHLVGREETISPILSRLGLKDPRISLVHASEVMTMEDKPVEGLRKKKDCSMVRAIELVRDGKADAIISPGNTGALVAGSLKLRRLEGVERPALAARMPSRQGDFVLIDAGANPICEPSHFAQFAVMGNIYAREILGKKNPRIGILSNGSESSKGNPLTREASALCSHLDLNFTGYAEGFDLFNDAVDVVVTDGFTGNVVLKSSEGLGYAMMHLLKSELTATPLRKLGAFLSRAAFRNIKRRIDPEIYGGAVLLGLRGNVIKTHGSAQARAVMNAIRLACEAVSHQLNSKIINEIQKADLALRSMTSSTTAPTCA